MERLTKRLAGTPLVKDGFFKKSNMSDYASICYGCTDIDACVTKCGFYKALDRLAEYEDLGMSPEEITALQEQLDISRAEVQGLSKKLVELQDQNNTLAYIVNMLNPLITESYNLKKENRELQKQLNDKERGKQ